MTVIALVGDFEAGVPDVVAAAVGRRAAEERLGRLAVQTGALRVPDARLPKLQAVFRAARRVPVEFTLWHAPGHALADREPPSPAWVGRLRTADALLLAAAGGQGLEAAATRLQALRTELALLDLAVLEPAAERLRQRATSGPRVERRAAAAQAAAVSHALQALEEDRPVLDGLTPPDAAALRGFGLLSVKPWAAAIDAPDDQAAAIDDQRRAAGRDSWCVLAAAIEAELHELPPDDADAFQRDLGLPGTAADRLSQALQRALDLVTFYTGNAASVNAWRLARGRTAVQAAGAVHTDLAEGFIRADVVDADRLIAAGSLARLRARGQIRRVGRDYEVADGDVIEVHFSR